MTLIILGPQGSGKGTQATRLAEQFGLAKFSMGDAIRSVIASRTPLGVRIKPIYEQGDLINLADTKAVVDEKFKQLNLSKGVVIEGIPRSLEQIEPLLIILKDNRLDQPWLVELKILDETAIARVGNRRICSACQYPAKPDDTSCVRCGSKLVRRTDEDDKTLQNRLSLYHQETEPVIEYFKKLGRHIAIDGEPAIDQVYEQILRSLEGRVS